MIDIEKQKNIEGGIFLVLFCLTIPLANWMIGNVGTTCVPNGPCLLPVAPGIIAPSGVLMIGAALVLRDLVQRRLGVEFGIGAIVVGAAISAGLAPGSLVIASAAAFDIRPSAVASGGASAGEAGRVGMVGVALHAHHLAIFDMGDERAHVGAIVRTDDSNGLDHTASSQGSRRGV